MSINNIQTQFATERFVNIRVLLPNSFITQANALLRKFQASLLLKVTPYVGAQLVEMIISRAPVHSAIYTNQYVRSTPNSSEYNIDWNCYPLHDHVNFTSVSQRLCVGLDTSCLIKLLFDGILKIVIHLQLNIREKEIWEKFLRMCHYVWTLFRLNYRSSIKIYHQKQ